jgi:hypothetical protein
MKTKYIISALLAAGLVSVAHAQVSSAVPDLVLGLQTAGGSTDYEADLGSMASYVGLSSPTTLNLSSLISASDIEGIFGSGAFTGGTVTLGAAATIGVSATTLNGVSETTKSTWITQANGTVVAGPWAVGTSSTSVFKDASTIGSNPRYQGIESVYNGLNAQPSLSTPNAAAVPSGGAAAWSSYVNSQAKNGFGAGFDAGTGLALTPGLFEVVDLFQYAVGSTSTSGTYTGSLELGSDGSLFFTNFDPIAVPEPSTYAAILGAASLAVVMIRRRKQQILA